MVIDLRGRIALVTGAARGIGLAIARALAESGARVMLVDVDEAALTSAQTDHSSSTRVLTTIADVSIPEQVQKAVAVTAAAFGGLDILVNNAGICPLTPLDQLSPFEWDRVLAVNLKSAFLFVQAALPHLRRSGHHGRIINIASVAGQMGGVLVGVHYAASKAGMIGLSKSLARILAPDGITVNSIAPGTIATDLSAAWSEEQQAHVCSAIPLGRFGEAEEIAALVCFLASNKAGFITGATLDINGGLYLR